MRYIRVTHDGQSYITRNSFQLLITLHESHVGDRFELETIELSELQFLSLANFEGWQKKIAR